MKLKSLLMILYMSISTLAYSQKTAVMDFDYLQFRSYFSDEFYDTTHGLELPRNAFTQKLYLTDKPEEQLYAIGVVKKDNGDDLFIIHRIISDQNLEYSSIVVFRNEQPLSVHLNEIIIENAPDSDGGVFNQFYEIESKTIKTNIFWSECCSSSGYNTPIAVKSSVDFVIDDTGNPLVLSVDTCLFSSRFFDANYLPSLIKNKELYPTKETPFALYLNNWTKPIESFYADAIQLSFYVEIIKDEPFTILESRNKSGNIIDTFKISKSKTSSKKVSLSIKDPIFKSLVLIKTSAGDIVLSPNGKFM